MQTSEAVDIGFEPDLSDCDGGDAMARREAAKFASGDNLDKDGKTKEHNRHQKFRDHVNMAALVLFWALICCVVLGLVTFVFHLLAPDSWSYLSGAQQDKLQTLLGAALLSSALTQYANKRMA